MVFVLPLLSFALAVFANTSGAIGAATTPVAACTFAQAVVLTVNLRKLGGEFFVGRG